MVNMIEMNQQEKFEELLGKAMRVGTAPFEAEAEALDRAHRHKTWCNCEACQRIRKKEGSVQFNVKVKSWVKVELHKLGGKEVARRLEEMVKSL